MGARGGVQHSEAEGHLQESYFLSDLMVIHYLQYDILKFRDLHNSLKIVVNEIYNPHKHKFSHLCVLGKFLAITSLLIAL